MLNNSVEIIREENIKIIKVKKKQEGEFIYYYITYNKIDKLKLMALQYSFKIKCLFPNIFLNKTLCNYCFFFITNGKNEKQIYKDHSLILIYIL